MCGLISKKMAISGGMHMHAHDPGMSRRQEKMEDKRGSNNHGGSEADLSPRQTSEGFLPSDPPPRQTRGFCLQILLYRPFADGLPWACYLRPAASSLTYSAASSWTQPVPAPFSLPKTGLAVPALGPRTIGTSCNRTTAVPWW